MTLRGQLQTEEAVHHLAEVYLNHAVLVLPVRVIDKNADQIQTPQNLLELLKTETKDSSFRYRSHTATSS